MLGHRGDPRRFRENTVASVASALDAGADGVEIDVRRLACGTTALFHDDSIEGVATESMRFEQLCRHESRLAAIDEIVALTVSRGAWIDIEIKRVGPEEKILGILPRDRCVVSSFDPAVLRRIRGLSAAAPIGIIFERDAAAALAVAEELDCSFLFPHLALLPEIAHCAADVAVIPWTVNDASGWRSAIDSGCSGVITDLPADAVIWKKKFAGGSS